MLLFQDALYVFSLQVVAVLLTAAVIGAVFLAKREEVPDPGDAQPPVPLRVPSGTFRHPGGRAVSA